MTRTLRKSASIWLVASRSESHLLVATAMRDGPDTDELVAVETSTVVEVIADAVLLTTVVLGAGAAVEIGVCGVRTWTGTGTYGRGRN
jgi:hypothetical protein